MTKYTRNDVVIICFECRHFPTTICIGFMHRNTQLLKLERQFYVTFLRVTYWSKSNKKNTEKKFQIEIKFNTRMPLPNIKAYKKRRNNSKRVHAVTIEHEMKVEKRSRVSKFQTRLRKSQKKNITKVFSYFHFHRFCK